MTESSQLGEEEVLSGFGHEFQASEGVSLELGKAAGEALVCWCRRRVRTCVSVRGGGNRTPGDEGRGEIRAVVAEEGGQQSVWGCTALRRGPCLGGWNMGHCPPRHRLHGCPSVVPLETHTHTP